MSDYTGLLINNFITRVNYKAGAYLDVYSFPNPPHSSPNANTQCSFHSSKLIQFALCILSVS